MDKKNQISSQVALPISIDGKENVIQPSADALLMKTETICTDNGNYIVSQKDARGNIVTNTLDEDGNGRVEAVTDPAGNTIRYGYDESNRIESVIFEKEDPNDETNTIQYILIVLIMLIIKVISSRHEIVK